MNSVHGIEVREGNGETTAQSMASSSSEICALITKNRFTRADDSQPKLSFMDGTHIVVTRASNSYPNPSHIYSVICRQIFPDHQSTQERYSYNDASRRIVLLENQSKCRWTYIRMGGMPLSAGFAASSRPLPRVHCASWLEPHLRRERQSSMNEKDSQRAPVPLQERIDMGCATFWVCHRVLFTKILHHMRQSIAASPA